MANQVRLKFGGSYNTRISAVNGPDTSSGYVGAGIVGLMIVGKTSAGSNKDQRFLNCFLQTSTDQDGRKRIYLVKRPGFETYITPASGQTGEAIMVWTGNGQKVISAFGDPTSTIYDGITSLGAITGETHGITETFIGANPTILVSSYDNTAWYYDAGATVSVMTKITDADFPGNAGKTLAGGFVHMDGFTAIMTSDGYIYASDLNSLIGWTATSFDAANAYPDTGVGLWRHKNMILAFGTESIQFFYNAGLTPFPFAKIPSMTLKIGAINANNAMTQISDVIFWCGTTPQGGLSVFKYDSGIQKISTSEIDSVLILAGTNNITMSSIRFFGRSFVICKASMQTFVYCIEENMWHEWSSNTPLWFKLAGTTVGNTMINYAISHVSTDGKIYMMDHASLKFTDDGYAYTARAQLASDDHGTAKRKFYHNLDIIADIESATSNLEIAYSDDDYQNWVTAGTVDLSTSRPRLTRLGSSRKRSWSFIHSANTPMRLEAAELELDVGQ